MEKKVLFFDIDGTLVDFDENDGVCWLWCGNGQFFNRIKKPS